jgi:hypothetical protein
VHKKKLKKLTVKDWPGVELDARTFQRPLGELTNTISLKVEREGVKRLKPNFAAIDIYMMLRQALRTYDLYFYLNADERRENDADWRVGYSAAILPLIRCMIDCLYNITSILNNPGPKGYQFRESGYKLALAALDADEKRYGGDPKWDRYIAGRRAFLDLAMRACGITLADVQAAKTWPTLSAYLPVMKVAIETDTQKEGRSPSERLLDDTSVDDLKAILVEKIRKSAKTGRLTSHPKLGTLLGIWAEWAGPDEPKVWVENFTQSDKGLVAFLEAMTDKGVASGSGDSLSYEFWYVQLKAVERFIDPEAVASRLEKLKPQVQNESQMRAVKAFQQAIDRRRSGKPDGMPWRDWYPED